MTTPVIILCAVIVGFNLFVFALLITVFRKIDGKDAHDTAVRRWEEQRLTTAAMRLRELQLFNTLYTMPREWRDIFFRRHPGTEIWYEEHFREEKKE